MKCCYSSHLILNGNVRNLVIFSGIYSLIWFNDCFQKALSTLLSIPMGKPKIFCYWNYDSVVISLVCKFTSVMCRRVICEAALLDALAWASVQACVVWRGGKGHSGAVPGTFGAWGCTALLSPEWQMHLQRSSCPMSNRFTLMPSATYCRRKRDIGQCRVGLECLNLQ